jgi:hypothetical protein
MRVITLGKSALGNNFFKYIHVFSYCKEHNIELYYSDKKNIDQFFDLDGSVANDLTTSSYLNNKFVKLILKGIVESWILLKVMNVFNVFIHYHFHASHASQLQIFGNRKDATLLILRDFRSDSSVQKNLSTLRAAFSLKQQLTINMEDEYRHLREQYKILVGVHVRRGDYERWKNGKYFFSDTTFNRKIHEFLDFKKFDPKDVGIIICSNGAIMLENFSRLNVHFSPRRPEEDLFLMGKCDYIIASPSTFSSMSSFIGSVPIYFLEDEEMTMFDERLHICSS